MAAVAKERYLLVWGEDGVVPCRLATSGEFTNKGVGPYDHRPTDAEIDHAIKSGVKFPQWEEFCPQSGSAKASSDAAFARDMIGRLADAEKDLSDELMQHDMKMGVLALSVGIFFGVLAVSFMKGAWPFDLMGTFLLVLVFGGLAWVYRSA